MFAQTHTFPALDTNNTFTGSNSFTNTHILSQLVPLQWGSNGLLVPDTGLSRGAAGIIAVGNGTQGDTSGSVSLGGNNRLQQDTGRFGAGALRLQNIGTNAPAVFTLMPSGTSTESDFRLYNTSDPVNTGVIDFDLLGTTLSINAGSFGTGSAPTVIRVSTPTIQISSGADQLVGRATTDTLTNKTLTAPNITSPSTTGTDSGVETLTNKTIGAGGLSGLTPSPQIFTSSGTFTIPAGVTAAKVTVVAGGGAGGGSDAGNTKSGAGGSSGSVGIKWLSGLTPGNTLIVTVGTGGLGASNAAGNNGNASSVASGTQTITSITTTGGNGGQSVGVFPSSYTPIVAQGTGGDINAKSSAGYPALSTAVPGGGGQSIFAAGSELGASGQFGGGGAGIANQGINVAGGNGGNGIVIFEWVK